MRTQDQITLRIYVRTREDFQAMRKSMDNRLGLTATGTHQKLKQERFFAVEDLENFNLIFQEAKRNEVAMEKMLRRALKRFPFYLNWLSQVKGIGEIAAGWILGEFDITKADTVSKLWQYAGLNPGLVPGQKRVLAEKYKPEMGEQVKVIRDEKGNDIAYHIRTNQLVRGDKATEGFILPFNKNLRTSLVGVLAPGFIKCQSPYALKYYYPYKARLEQEQNRVSSIGNRDEGKPWQEVSKGHRDNAAKRYMIKMFLKDLYVAWRTHEGLPVRVPYAEEYLGIVHQWWRISKPMAPLWRPF